MQLLRKILFPFSLLYALVVRIRNFMFDKGWLPSYSFDVPTLCVGNLSVGGTGKTPMVEFLVERLQGKHQLAVLSRGYGRKSKGFVLADRSNTVTDLGDEPFQIFNKFPNIQLAVDADRRHGIAQLQAAGNPSLILLDDAFQHRRVRPTMSLLLTAYGHLYPKDWYLPTGNLRDARNQAKRADALVVTKCPADMGLSEMQEIESVLKPRVGQLVLFSCLAYSDTLYGTGADMPVADLAQKSFTLVTGIANPAPLVAHLRALGLQFEHLVFKDHHFFTETELAKINAKGLILTTEKDYVRLVGHIDQLYYIGVKHQFLGDGESRLIKLLTKLGKA